MPGEADVRRVCAEYNAPDALPLHREPAETTEELRVHAAAWHSCGVDILCDKRFAPSSGDEGTAVLRAA